MLIYHPAYDAYHCVFRMLVITERIKRVDIAKLRIIDFYLAFPAEVVKIRLPRNDLGIKKTAQNLRNIYHGPLNSIQTFRDMKHLQFAALRTLAASDFLSSDLLNEGVIQRIDKPLPDEMILQQEMFNEDEKDVFNFITNQLFELPLSGQDGLKDRTGLMEYRYDNV